MGDTIKLLVLSVVQGLAEFLPISSSGHLALTEKALGIESPGPGLELFLHIGTLLSICFFYRKRLFELVSSLLRFERDAARYAADVVVSTLPAPLAYLAGKEILDGAFDSVRAIGALLVVNGCLLVLSRVTDIKRPTGGSITWWRALAMGVGQAVAILPGISRSGTSIHAGRLAGMDGAKAAEFSFLMSIPAICGATALEFRSGDTAEALVGFSAWEVALATVVSAFVGYIALSMVVRTIERGKFWTFGVWCVCVGAVAFFCGR